MGEWNGFAKIDLPLSLQTSKFWRPDETSVVGGVFGAGNGLHKVQ
jgi:hypothetical protein